MNDFKLWEMLSNNIGVDMISCLMYSIKYSSYELFGNILYQFTGYDTLQSIDYNDLCEWASQNPDYRMYQFIKGLEQIISQTNKFDRAFVINNWPFIANNYNSLVSESGCYTK